MKVVKVFAGIDGGATKTRVVLTDESGLWLAESVAGPSNYQTVGLDAALANILDSVAEALGSARCAPADLQGVVGGFAGFDTPGDLDAVAGLMQRAARRWGDHLSWVAVNDAVVAWAGALAAQPGAIVMSGTGAIAFAVNAAGRSVRSDGWGHWLGDEGSGFDIGRHGLMAALRAVDGRGEPTRMVDVLVAHGDEQAGGDWADWIVQITQDGADSHGQISAFAPEVSRLAALGDPVCVDILAHAGHSLARTAASVIRRSGLDGGPDLIPVAVAGSVLTKDALLRRLFTEQLDQQLPGCQVIDPLTQPAEGAALLARQPHRLPKDVLRVTSEQGELVDLLIG